LADKWVQAYNTHDREALAALYSADKSDGASPALMLEEFERSPNVSRQCAALAIVANPKQWCGH
jgi:hypothetical protein